MNSKIQRNFFFLLVVLGFMAVTSCASQDNRPLEEIATDNPPPTPIEIMTTRVITINVPATNTPVATQTSVTTFTEDQPEEDKETSGVAQNTRNTPTESTFLLCSPLGIEKIEQLWEIISDPYNPPPPGRDERHQGVDFSYYRRNDRMGIEGEKIQAILEGTVVAKVNDRLPYGNMVIIETPGELLPALLRSELGIKEGESLYHLYAHMKNEPGVDLYDNVECGQVIGLVGATGYNVVNAHLHLETRVGPQKVILKTMVFYDTSATPIEMENYKRWRTSGEFVHFDPMKLFGAYIDKIQGK